MVKLDPGWFEIIEELVSMELEHRGGTRRLRFEEIRRLRSILVSRVGEQLEQGLASLLERLVLAELKSITDEEIIRFAGAADRSCFDSDDPTGGRQESGFDGPTDHDHETHATNDWFDDGTVD